jgi:hypothetical protein
LLKVTQMNRTVMNDHTTGIIGLFMGWYFGFIGFVSVNWVPMVLSSIASLMAIVNYYYLIKKNRTK